MVVVTVAAYFLPQSDINQLLLQLFVVGESPNCCSLQVLFLELALGSADYVQCFVVFLGNFVGLLFIEPR